MRLVTFMIEDQIEILTMLIISSKLKSIVYLYFVTRSSLITPLQFNPKAKS